MDASARQSRCGREGDRRRSKRFRDRGGRGTDKTREGANGSVRVAGEAEQVETSARFGFDRVESEGGPSVDGSRKSEVVQFKSLMVNMAKHRRSRVPCEPEGSQSVCDVSDAGEAEQTGRGQAKSGALVSGGLRVRPRRLHAPSLRVWFVWVG